MRIVVCHGCVCTRATMTRVPLIPTTQYGEAFRWAIGDTRAEEGRAMPEWTSGKSEVLVVEIESRVCALPLAQVIETMRPLAVESLANVPRFVSGVAIIRGIPTPVVDLGALLGRPNECVERFVTIRAGDRQLAISVSAVLGIRDLNAAMMMRALPPLLRDASNDVVEAIGSLDEQVLMILRAGWELPDEVWQALAVQETVA